MSNTNVFVSAALKENSLPFLLARWIDRHDGLLKSAATEHQLRSSEAALYCRGADPYAARGPHENAACGRAGADHRAHRRLPRFQDDKFLELAVNGRADDLIVTGAGDLLALNPFRQIPIVMPAAFMQGVIR